MLSGFGMGPCVREMVKVYCLLQGPLMDLFDLENRCKGKVHLQCLVLGRFVVVFPVGGNGQHLEKGMTHRHYHD